MAAANDNEPQEPPMLICTGPDGCGEIYPAGAGHLCPPWPDDAYDGGNWNRPYYTRQIRAD